jgi:hypothetical protein
MTLDGSPDFVVPGIFGPAGRDKAPSRSRAKAGTRLMPDSHNGAKQSGQAVASVLDGFSRMARAERYGNRRVAAAG